jgi:hypothetical protein
MRTDSARRLSGRDVGVLLGGVYAVMQLLIMPIGRHPAWDEAIYLSQVTPGAGGTPFAPSRARGISLLVAPFTGVGLSLTVTRAVLIVLSAAALVVVFAAWRPIVGFASASAACVAFGCSWLAVFYGSEVMPNLWVAFLGVASVGLLARHVDGSQPRHAGLLMAMLLALMALFRPFDALILASISVVLGLALLHVPWRALMPIVIGSAVGALPWVIEMSIRYGNPPAAIRAAGETGHVSAGSFVERLHQFILLGDGPLIGPRSGGGFPILVVAWLAVLGVFTWLGIRWSVGVRRTGVVLAALSGAIFIGLYALLVGGLAPRFLLPGLALIAVPCGVGVMEVWQRLSGLARPAAVFLAGMWIASHVVVASDLGRASAEAREGPAMVGLFLRDLSQQPCSVGAVDSFPEIAYASGCSGSMLTQRSLTRGLDARGSYFAVTHLGEQPAWFPGAGLQPIATIDDNWLVYRSDQD